MTPIDPLVRAPFLAFLLAFAAACGAGSAGTIEATGTVEFTETAIAATSLGRVERVLVDEGDRVRAGDTLVVLVQPTLAATRAQLAARAASARAVLADAVRGPRPAEISAAEANVAALTADAARTASDVTRLTPLAERDYTSAQQFEAARAAASVAAARRDAAVAQLDLLREGTRAEQVAARRADLAAAEAALAVADATARDLVLLAPVDGRVLTRRAEPGEVLPVGATALVLAETGRQWVRIYVGQAALPLIRPGATVTATLDAFPDRPISGVVREVSTQAEYTPRVALTEKERADLLFGVRAEFRDTTEMLKAGLPVTVRLARPIP
jgi:HlyD family secretion protein